MIAIFTMLLACGEKATDTASDDTTTEDTASGSSTGSSGAGAPSDSIPGYVNSYCSEYAMRCGLYSSQEICYDDVITWFNLDTCSVSDTAQLDTCVTWLSELSCEESGWIDECSNFYTCE